MTHLPFGNHLILLGEASEQNPMSSIPPDNFKDNDQSINDQKSNLLFSPNSHLMQGISLNHSMLSFIGFRDPSLLPLLGEKYLLGTSRTL